MDKIFTIIMVLGLFMPGMTQNNILRGIVKLQSSGSQAIEGVEISAFGAGTVYSNSVGMFELKFADKVPGMAVRLLISRSGHEVVNEKEVERCILREDPDDLITIVMSRAGDRNRQALAYYNIIVKTTNKKYEHNLAEIKSQLDDLTIDKEERKSLRQQISALQEEKRGLIEKAENLAKQLSSIDLDRASSLAQKAYDKFNSGDIEGALEILNEQTLKENLQSSKNEVIKLKEKVSQANQAFHKSIENYMIKARMCISLGRFEEASHNYIEAIKADSTNVQHIREVADYYNNLNDQKEALKYFTIAMEISPDVPSKILLLIKMGNQHRFNKNFDAAQATYSRAVELSDYLSIDQFNLIMAHIRYAWGLYYMEVNNPNKAISELQKSLDYWRILNNQDSLNYKDYEGSVLVNLAAIYAQEGDLEQAVDMGIKYVQIFELLYTTDSIKFKRDLITAYTSLAIIYAKQQTHIQAEKLFLLAIDQLKRMNKLLPQKYESDLARTFGNLGALYMDMKKFNEAENALLSSKEILKRLAKNNPARYENNLAVILNNLGGLYSHLKQFEKAISEYNETLDIRRQLFTEQAEASGPGLLLSILNTSGLKKALLESTMDMNYKQEGLTLVQEAQSVISITGTSSHQLQTLNNGINYFKNYFQNINEEELLIQNELKKITPFELKKEATSDPEILIATSNEIIDSLTSFLNKYPEHPTLISRLAQEYGNLSWHHLLNKEYQKAVNAGEEGLIVDAESKWCKSYLATAYLYNNKYDQAVNIYMELKDQPDGANTYTETFLDDFNTLEKLGIPHENVIKIRNLLKK
jgi:tetratricopeptide (TPR) repeat protein